MFQGILDGVKSAELGRTFTRVPVNAEWGPMANPSRRAFLALLEEMRVLYLNKSADYGSDGDPFANYREAEDVGVPAWMSATARMLEKVGRVKAFIKKGELKNEPFEDALIDLASIALIALVLYRETKQDEPCPTSSGWLSTCLLGAAHL